MRPKSTCWIDILAAAFVGWWVLFASAAAVLAAPSANAKVTQALLSAAQKEFDAGNLERAGELFNEIWKQNKVTAQAAESRPALYNAARAYQMAGKLDKAEELFREMLALENLDPATKVKCDNQLLAITEKRSEQKAEAAAAAEQAGQLALAAGMWADALRLQPGKLAWRLRLARALQLAGKPVEARAAYGQWLAAAAADAADRPQVQAWHDELAPVAAKPVGGAPVVIDKPLQSQANWPARTLLGVGAAGLVGGGVLLALASADDTALQAKFAKTDSAGHIVGLSPAQATEQAAQVESAYLRGFVAVGVGAAAVGVGVWLLFRGVDTKGALVPTANGAAFVARF